jgi:hypothetical protein
MGVVTAAEAPVEASLHGWQHYEISWTEHDARFRVAGEEILVALSPPLGPLGFVAWIDNQFAVASPQGGFRFGVLPAGHPQWLEIRDLRIEASHDVVPHPR